MANRTRKRLSTKENKILKFDNLELKDVICSICQSILVEPVTLPCYHFFCQRCFSGSVENNALCCPLCRLRIGSWLRTATKQNSLVNNELWDYIRNKFPNEIDTKINGGDVYLEVTEKPAPRLSAPGEIRSEYETELKRLKEEQLRLEQKHLQETELLIKKIQLEEAEAQKRYMEMLKQDEMLAKQMQKERVAKAKTKVVKRKLQNGHGNTRLKPTRLDSYLAKTQALPTKSSSPVLTDDNSSVDESSPALVNCPASPEMIPSYSKISKPTVDMKINNSKHNDDIHEDELDSKKICDQGINQTISPEQRKDETTHRSWKQNETNFEEIPRVKKQSYLLSLWEKYRKENPTGCKEKEINKDPPPPRTSLPVSLPLPKSRDPQNAPLDNDLKNLIPLEVIQARSTTMDCKNKQMFLTSKTFKECVVPKKMVMEEERNTISSEAKASSDEPKSKTPEQRTKRDAPPKPDSVDSMLQELCYFEPVEKPSFKRVPYVSAAPVVRVPCQRPGDPAPRAPPPPPAPVSRAQYLDSLCHLRHLSLANNLSSAFVIALDMLKAQKTGSETVKNVNRKAADDKNPVVPTKKNCLTKNDKSPAQTCGDAAPCRRRTRSMGSLTKDDLTPKKPKYEERTSVSERKHYLRSDSKKRSAQTNLYSPVAKIVKNKIQSAVKNLSAPLDNCDVKSILQQIRIQKMIEKQDMELARKMDIELNGRRQLRRVPASAAVKRRDSLNHNLRTAKKLRV